MQQNISKIMVNITFIIAISLLLMATNTWWRMQTQYRAGEKALAAGDFPAAVAGFESAIRMYLPASRTVEQAAEKLWQMGESNEAAGDITRALIAYRSLRSSFYAVKWLKAPGQEWIARCDEKIRSLVPLQRER